MEQLISELIVHKIRLILFTWFKLQNNFKWKRAFFSISLELYLRDNGKQEDPINIGLNYHMTCRKF